MIVPLQRHQACMNVFGRIAALGHGGDGQVLAPAAQSPPAQMPATEVRPGRSTAILPPSIFSPSGAPVSVWPMALNT
jgi:hypothetical protein